MNHVTTTIHPAVRRYSAGEVTAEEAAELMGGDATVHDVVYQMREAGLPLPRASHDAEQAALARALKLCGLT